MAILKLSEEEKDKLLRESEAKLEELKVSLYRSPTISVLTWADNGDKSCCPTMFNVMCCLVHAISGICCKEQRVWLIYGRPCYLSNLSFSRSLLYALKYYAVECTQNQGFTLVWTQFTPSKLTRMSSRDRNLKYIQFRRWKQWAGQIYGTMISTIF